ncbi:MAG: YdcF family protein [Kiritimatiellia bacterium]
MKIKRLLSRFLIATGILTLLLAFSCLTPQPWKLLKWLHARPAGADFQPAAIVVLGGGGIPAESTLSRCYAGAEMARKFPGVRLIIAIPSNGAGADSPEALMRLELKMRGVDPARIDSETRGRDTREQALNVAALLGPAARTNALLVVTSDYHMRRSLACFRKAGFTRVAGHFATDNSVDADLGAGQALRYTFWSAAEVLVVSLREIVALGWYQLRGWI